MHHLQMLQALREQLEAVEAPTPGDGRSASGVESIREGLVQVWSTPLTLACVALIFFRGRINASGIQSRNDAGLA